LLERLPCAWPTCEESVRGFRFELSAPGGDVAFVRLPVKAGGRTLGWLWAPESAKFRA
jgi:hypothetical protein